MEPTKVQDTDIANENANVVEMGRVSEETKGVVRPDFESLLFPATIN